MAPHSNTLAWKIPWTEEPGRLQAIGSRRVGHDWATSLSLFTFKHWRRKWQPTPVFLPGGSQGRGSRCAAVYGVAQSPTQLRRLSSSCSSNMLAPIVFFRNFESAVSSLSWLGLVRTMDPPTVVPASSLWPLTSEGQELHPQNMAAPQVLGARAKKKPVAWLCLHRMMMITPFLYFHSPFPRLYTQYSSIL